MIKNWFALLFLALSFGLAHGWNEGGFFSDYEEEYAEMPPTEQMEETLKSVSLPQAPDLMPSGVSVDLRTGLISQYSLGIHVVMDNEFEDVSDVEDYDDEGIYETNVPMEVYKPSRSWNIRWAPLIISTILMGGGTAMILYFEDKAKKEREDGRPTSLDDYNTRHDDIKKYQEMRNWGWGLAIAGSVGFVFSLIF